MNDFKSAQAIRTSSLRTALRNKQFGRFSDMAQGLALSYINGINAHFDYVGMLTGSFPDYAVKNTTATGKGSLLLELDASIRAKLFSSKYFVTPYLQAGLGGSYYRNHWGAFVPAGIGLQARLLDEAFLLVNAQYRLGVADKTSHHFFYSIGLAGTIGKKKTPARILQLPALPLPVKDADEDGIIDSLDDCPQQKGLPAFKGCPDMDGDSIPDKDDKCPYQKGLTRYQGCPIPDTDGDGIHDEADKCPAEKGLAAYQGCPPPDHDRDGVADEADGCPDLPGVAANNGCPEIREEVKKKVAKAAQHIFFASGSATLLPKSYKALDEVIKVLQDDAHMKIAIEGHTDNTGTATSNQLLSERRARAVRTYFINKGITAERLSADGYGEDRPIADNNTASGRSVNRRVVLNLGYQ